MSLRIAYRSVNDLADEPTTVEELSRLAEFCVVECLIVAKRRWTERLGEPWDEALGRPARFGVLALGKLGGAELNFSSDIDLIYAFDGDGVCRKDGLPTAVSNLEYFTKVAEATTRFLSESTGDGFLFRVDARLRPEGAWGPLVHSIAALEHHYGTSGQTWERLALLKARPLAGDLELGAELLEDLHGFRYPRRPPPSLLAEVAAMKRRTEREVVGAAALERNVKLGPGGIREIEFLVQSLQLLHAGAYPFLQTHRTGAALELLARYRLLDAGDARFLGEAYWFLRRVEHRLQMRDESQTHDLPEDPGEFEALAASLGYASAEAFRAALDGRRRRVQALFAACFADSGEDREFEAWWEFLTTERTPPLVAGKISRWFGGAEGADGALRRFACGDRRLVVSREFVTRFQHLAANFDSLVPQLARPLETLARLARCAERYGTRQQFLNACADHTALLNVMALLCDRSGYSAELLCAHPEILEEVLRPENLRRRKTPRDLASELAAGPADGPEFGPWLWLYIRAEQVRHLIGHLLGLLTGEAVEAELTGLADAVLTHLASETGVLLVALGKYGGGELTFGSDLDLLVVAAEGAEAGAGRTIDRLHRLLHRSGPLGPAFALDLRLRPHGEAGPAATTLPALEAYHRPGGGAQTWERQILLRSRVVAGPPELRSAFESWSRRATYGTPPSEAEEAEIWALRARIERERGAVSPRERAIKTGPGGLIDAEFLAQVLQWRHGGADPSLRLQGTRPALKALEAAGHLPSQAAEKLLDNFNFLKAVELALRRDANRGLSVLPSEPGERRALARWLGWREESEFWRELVGRLHATRALVRELGAPGAENQLQP
jgi:glutamate-ammonia-ligase adenylyltransferase